MKVLVKEPGSGLTLLILIMTQPNGCFQWLKQENMILPEKKPTDGTMKCYLKIQKYYHIELEVRHAFVFTHLFRLDVESFRNYYHIELELEVRYILFLFVLFSWMLKSFRIYYHIELEVRYILFFIRALQLDCFE